jgi:hypothetical protein
MPCLRDISLRETGLSRLNLAKSTRAVTAYLPFEVNFIKYIDLRGYIDT